MRAKGFGFGSEVLAVEELLGVVEFKGPLGVRELMGVRERGCVLQTPDPISNPLPLRLEKEPLDPKPYLGLSGL